MSDLIPLFPQHVDGETIQTVNARDLHMFLHVHRDFSTWIKARITQYGFLESIDFIRSPELVSENPNPRIEYFISLDMAKELAMVERTAKGKEARQYFITCEKALKHHHGVAGPGNALVPKVHDPAIQMLIDMAVQLDEARAIATEAKQVAAVAATKADLALEDAHRMTLEEFILKNGLVRQFPQAQFAQYSHWLTTFSRSYGLPIQKAPVYGKSWSHENSYALGALAAWLRYETNRPRQATLVHIPT